MKQERRLAAIMFTDIAGYTALMGRDEHYALQLVKKNRALQKPCIEKHGGIWIKEMGDGVLASFISAHDALECGLEIQLSADSMLKDKIRIGIHLGDITYDNKDVFGDGVNIASRIESVANPGGVYFSEAVMNAVESTGDFKVHFVGALKLKNVREPTKTYCLQHQGLPDPISSKIRQLLADRRVESLAILPFDNLSGHADQQYFVDGMHDALIGELSRIGALRVISRTSTLQYRKSEKSILRIAEELQVDALIEASVLRIGDDVRIQVQLIQVFPVEQHLWSASYDRRIENIFALHSEVVKDITEKVKVKMTPKESRYLAETRIVNSDAYKAYLNGKFHLEKLSEIGFIHALESLEKSLELDPSFAPAYAELANYYMYSLQMRLISVSEAIPKIYQNNQKALDIDPDLSEANYTKSLMSWFAWEWDNCEKNFQKVLYDSPNHVLANAFYSHLLMLKDQFKLAKTHIKKAINLDPKNDLILSLYGVVLAHNGEFDHAMSVAQEALAINQQNILTLRLLEFVSYARKDFETSIEMLDVMYSRIFPIDLDIRREFEENGYGSTISKLAKTMEMNITGQDAHIGVFFNRAGQYEKALHWIEKAYENHDSDIPYLFRTQEINNLKSKPRMIALADKINLPI